MLANFLQSKAKSPGTAIDKNYCEMDSQYTKSLLFQIIPAFNDDDKNIVVLIKVNKS